MGSSKSYFAPDLENKTAVQDMHLHSHSAAASSHELEHLPTACGVQAQEHEVHMGTCWHACRVEAREQLRRQVGTLRFDLNALAEVKPKEEKKKAQALKKEFLNQVRHYPTHCAHALHQRGP